MLASRKTPPTSGECSPPPSHNLYSEPGVPVFLSFLGYFFRFRKTPTTEKRRRARTEKQKPNKKHYA
jgi:hypothetical protein